MNDQLTLLLSLLEEEKLQLQARIDAYLAESDYLLAHYLSEALYQLNGRLQILRSMEDKKYPQKESLRKTIHFFENRIAMENSTPLKEVFEKLLMETKEKLDRLHSAPNKSEIREEASLVKNACIDLLENKIKSFRLVLKKSANLLIEFRYRKKTLQLRLPNIKLHIRKQVIDEIHIQRLQNLGFILSATKSNLQINVTGSKEDILVRLLIILSIITFEIFSYSEFEGESYILFSS